MKYKVGQNVDFMNRDAEVMTGHIEQTYPLQLEYYITTSMGVPYRISEEDIIAVTGFAVPHPEDVYEEVPHREDWFTSGESEDVPLESSESEEQSKPVKKPVTGDRYLRLGFFVMIGLIWYSV